MKTMCVTGHRPDKLWGYDLSAPEYTALKDKIKEVVEIYINKHNVSVFISGGALGVDQIFFTAIDELKEKYSSIENHLYMPFESQADNWSKKYQLYFYSNIHAKADEVVIVCDGEYEAWKMLARNKKMVDESDYVMCVWDGSKGGTAHCVDYAVKKEREMISLPPFLFEKEI